MSGNSNDGQKDGRPARRNSSQVEKQDDVIDDILASAATPEEQLKGVVSIVISDTPELLSHILTNSLSDRYPLIKAAMSGDVLAIQGHLNSGVEKGSREAKAIQVLAFHQSLTLGHVEFFNELYQQVGPLAKIKMDKVFKSFKASGGLPESAKFAGVMFDQHNSDKGPNANSSDKAFLDDLDLDFK